MSNILEKLKESAHLSENECVIADYMINHVEDIPNLSTREFAQKTYTSATSIVRFVKKLGYKNYNDFKYNIVSALKNIKSEDYRINSDEDILTLFNKLFESYQDVIQKTKEIINIKEFYEIMQFVTKTKYIDILANDTNATIAQYASHCLSGVGKIVNVYQETDKQLYFTLNATKDHLVFIVTKYSRNEHLLNAALNLRKRGIQTVAVTSSLENTISKLCTYTLHTPFNGNQDKTNEMGFYTSLKYLFDFMYAVLFSQNYDMTLQKEELYNQIFFKPFKI